jgi:hypothetical protein
MKCDLQTMFAELSKKLPAHGERGFAFSQETFGAIPGRLETDQLVIVKRHHDYEGSRVDMLAFSAEPAFYLNLGLLILAVVFRPETSRATLHLTNSSSEIKSLVIEYRGTTPRGSGYRTRPDGLLFHMDTVATHPWTDEVLTPGQLPRFVLTNPNDALVTEEDWAARDSVRGFGSDEASVRLACLLLRFGSPENKIREIVLEGENGGRRGVGLRSAEASFHVSGSPGCEFQ